MSLYTETSGMSEKRPFPEIKVPDFVGRKNVSEPDRLRMSEKRPFPEIKPSDFPANLPPGIMYIRTGEDLERNPIILYRPDNRRI